MMTGWKTWLAALSAFCTGIVMAVNGALADPFDADAVYQGVLACIAALAMVGIGHKIEKGNK